MELCPIKNERLDELVQIIKNKRIRTVFQPIISLKDGSTIGYEALSRGPEGSLLESPLKLFNTAKKHKMTWELELLCRTKALEKFKNFNNFNFLFLNVEPYIINDEKFQKGFTKDNIFKFNPSIHGIPVVKDNRPSGLIMRNKFYTHMASQYGVILFMGRPINLIMDRSPLILDYFTPDLLLNITQLELNVAKHSNPLTGLPGNLIIEEKLKKILKGDTNYYVIYVDLDNFKAYNDVYGFENGDQVLAMTASLLSKILSLTDPNTGFLGHIGGDDLSYRKKHRKLSIFVNVIIIYIFIENIRLQKILVRF